MALGSMNQIGVPQERIDRARELKEQGFTGEEIGKELGISRSRANIYVLYSGWTNPNPVSVRIVQARKLHYVEKLSYRKVAKAMGISKSYAHELVHDPFKRLRVGGQSTYQALPVPRGIKYGV